MGKFEKPATSIPEQVDLLRRRRLIVSDIARAERCLELISYYRLRPYWLPFEVPAHHDGDHAFRKGAMFEDVLTLYKFDQQLWRLVLDGIEPVEIALRAQWAHHMAMTHGPHGYLEASLYKDKNRERHEKAKDKLAEDFERSKDTFAEHYRKTYTSPRLPPAWMAAEVMSLGQLSKWISDLKQREDRQAIAKSFGPDERFFTSFCSGREGAASAQHAGRPQLPLGDRRAGNAMAGMCRSVDQRLPLSGSSQDGFPGELADTASMVAFSLSLDHRGASRSTPVSIG